MENIRYYPYALTTLQVQALFSTYGRYAFNGGVTDSSGNGYDLTANGSPTYGIDGGVYGQYIILDGVDDYLTASANTVFNVTTQDFSIWGYIYPTSVSNTGEIVIKRDSGAGTNAGYEVLMLSDATFNVRFTDGSASFTSTSPGSLTANTWYFWAATFDRDGNLTAHLYNLSTGAYASSTANISTLTSSATNTQTFTVGRRSASSADFFAGRIDHLNVLLGTALTTQNVKDIISTLHGGQIAECHGTGSGFTTGITYRRNMENTSWEQLVDLTSTQTMTNKTLTSPTITTPTVTGGTFSNISYLIDSETLGGDAASISTGTFTAKEQLRITGYIYGYSAGTPQIYLRFNNDSGSNYAYKFSADLAAYTTGTSAAQIVLAPAVASGTDDLFFVIDVINVSANEKLITWQASLQATAGAGNNVTHIIGSAKWANTAAQITRVDLVASANNISSGSWVAVEGVDV
jgi:hypothetical protein